MFLSREGRDLGVAFQDPPGCQASSRAEAKDSAVLLSRDADLLEPPVASVESSLLFILERGLGIGLQAMQEKKALHLARMGASQGFPRAAAPVGVSREAREDLREPLVRRQGSQVSLCVARRSALWLSSNGRGLGPQDALKRDSRGLSRVVAGKSRFPRLLPGTLGNFPGCL